MYKIFCMVKTALIVLLLFAVFSCSLRESVNPGLFTQEQGFGENIAGNTVTGNDTATSERKTDKNDATENKTVKEAPKALYLTLVAAGDNLFHSTMIQPHPETGAYDFTSYYSEIKSLIEPADIAFINQETLLGGKKYGFSGYPRFNTPQEAGAALAAAGFDIVNHATNHVMDKGEGAIFATMDYWDTIPHIKYLGIYRSQEERNTKKVIIEKNDIKVGFLAYTYGTNSLAIPKDKPYLVSLINDSTMETEINALRPLCDFLVVSMHWGEEYRYSITKEQERLSRFLADNRVDLIIGHHPHVLEPYTFLDRPDGGKTLCFYSLGNFLSAQQTDPTQLGGIAFVRIKQSDKIVTVKEAGIIPIVNHYEADSSSFRVYPLYNYSEDRAKKHLLQSRSQNINPLWLRTLAEEILAGGNILLKNPFAEDN